jgi:hypothetical protein
MNYNFDDFKDFIIGNEVVYSGCIKFVIHSNNSPLLNEIISYNNEDYTVVYTEDVTSD